MRKLFVLVMALALIGVVVGDVWAAQATVTITEYGYCITGGTDETRVAAGRIRVRGIGYAALTANNIAQLRSGAVSGTAWYMKATAASNAPGGYMYFGENGVVFDELSVKLTEAQDVVYIFN